MAHRYDMAVFIARMQPLHNGHMTVIKTALQQAKNVLVLIGSSSSPRSMRNPFTFDERKQVLETALKTQGTDTKRVHIKPINDYTYNDSRWIHQIQTITDRTAWCIGYTDTLRVALIGHSKDNTSYYLKLFPQWDSIEVDNHAGINSTAHRVQFFSDKSEEFLSDAVVEMPQATLQFLERFKKTAHYETLRNEFEFIQKYRQSWAAAPYAPTFVTVDAIVVQSGHVLLVRRRAAPGKGLWAMPGGFLNPQERIEDAALRELREETGIKVPEPVLRGSIVARDVFDDPNRSERGRTITHCFLLKLRDDTSLPRVRGMDDADKARWCQISDLKPQDFFEDHYHILYNMLARI